MASLAAPEGCVRNSCRLTQLLVYSERTGCDERSSANCQKQNDTHMVSHKKTTVWQAGGR